MNRLAAFLVTLSRQLFWVAAFGLILAALYVSLGRQLVPLVAEYRTELQERVRTALDMPVTVGRLEGRWEGLAPRLLAHDVLLGEGDSAMRLDRIAVVPDLAGSLWARSWRLSSLEFSGVHLSVLEGEDGKWQVKGLPERDDATPPDPQTLLEAPPHLRGLAPLASPRNATTRWGCWRQRPKVRPVSRSISRASDRSLIATRTAQPASVLRSDGAAVSASAMARILLSPDTGRFRRWRGISASSSSITRARRAACPSGE